MVQKRAEARAEKQAEQFFSLFFRELHSSFGPMKSMVQGIIDIAHKNGALVMVDNNIMSPILMKPIELGADIVMLAATKFISCHSHVMAGVLLVKSESLAKDINFLQNAEGAGLAPCDYWLCLRGLKQWHCALRSSRCEHCSNLGYLGI